MAERWVTVVARNGLHARPAALFAKAAADSGHQVVLARPEGVPAPGRSVIAVLALAARAGDRLLLTVTGPEAERVAGELAELLEADHDAPS